MRNTTTDPRHEATVTALERRVAARDSLDGYERGQLEAVRRHSPALEPRVDEILRTANRNAARKTKRTPGQDQPPDSDPISEAIRRAFPPPPTPRSEEQRAADRAHWTAFVERGEVQ